jgi:Holliday junction DNA helicase RuvB
MELYNEEEICKILRTSSKKMKINIDEKVLKRVSVAARGTPRLANRVLKRLGDISLIRGKNIVDKTVVDEFFAIENLSSDGLGPDDIRYIVKLYSVGMSAGLNSIASVLNIDVDTVLQKIEPFLLHNGFIMRKRSGRALTPMGIERAIRELTPDKK